MKPRIVLAACVCVLAAPTVAQAATLQAINKKPCYGTGDRVALGAQGFTPNGSTKLAIDQREYKETLRTGADGSSRITATLPLLRPGKRFSIFSLRDLGGTQSVATTSRIRVSPLRVRIRPRNARPNALRRIRAGGFTTGRTLYMHVVRGGRSRNVRIGALKGPCRSLSARKRIFNDDFRVGQYRVQFDTARRYRASRLQKFLFRFTVTRTPR